MKDDKKQNAGTLWKEIGSAVVKQAADDYRSAWIKLLKKRSPYAEKMLKETERFFRSEEFALYTGADGKWILAMLEMERREGERRIADLQAAEEEMVRCRKDFCRSGKKNQKRPDRFIRAADFVKELFENLPEYLFMRYKMDKDKREMLKEAENWKDPEKRKSPAEASGKGKRK